ncbi:Alpha-1,6-mannosyl-glycoprotein 2-beta-N-acetylglucosaminyltransferase [Chamberlinius hualienensis]
MPNVLAWITKMTFRRKSGLVAIFIILLFLWFNLKAFKKLYTHQILKNDDSAEITDNSPSELLRRITNINKRQKIYNEDKYGPIQTNTIIIVIQYHIRLQHFIATLKTLENAKYIEETLLVISHDIYDDKINHLVQGIQFARVMQIFYPYSIQFYPNSFPGPDPNDCPRDISKEKAMEIRCNYVENPNSYRQANMSQMKNHWWWKNVFVFDELRVMKNHTGMVMLLEEDYYVTPDIIHVLKLITELQPKHCPQCNFIYMGNDPENIQYEKYSKRADIYTRLSTEAKRGATLTKETWKILKDCAKEYCNYNDYNWDFTMKYMGKNCLAGKLKTLAISATRIFHLKECGFHYKNRDCNVEGRTSEISQLIETNRPHLFPNELHFFNNYDEEFAAGPNGGFADKRDHSLCLNMTKSN